MTKRAKPEPINPLDEGYRLIRQWYYSEVRSWAESYDKRINNKEWDDCEAFQESFDEETDSAQIVIYTFQARCALLASDHEDAYQDEYGVPAPTVEAAVLMAFRADILETMGEDPNQIGEES